MKKVDTNAVILNSQVVPARNYMNDLLYGGQSISDRASILGLDGDYIQPANKYGLVQPPEFDSRGHQLDSSINSGGYDGGKMPWHITSSNESKFSPDSGTWTPSNIEGGYVYTPSIQQLNQHSGLGTIPYTTQLKSYFQQEEAPVGNTIRMPIPVNPKYLKSK